MASKKKRSVTIKLTDLENGSMETDITFSPPVSREKAVGAQRMGYMFLEYLNGESDELVLDFLSIGGKDGVST